MKLLNLSYHQKAKFKSKTIEVFSIIVRLLALYAISFTILYPLIFMAVSALRDRQDLYNPSVIWITRNFTLDNIKYIFEFMNYPSTLTRTLLISFFCGIFQVASCAFVGYGFARYKFKGKNILFILVIFTLIIPIQSYITPLYLNFRNFNIPIISQFINIFIDGKGTLNLINNPAAFWVQSICAMDIRSGLFIFIFRQFFTNMPRELDDAGSIDGCGHFGVYFRIMLPNAVSAMTTVFIFSFVWHWNDFFTTSVLSTNANTLATTLSSLRETIFRAEGPDASDLLLQQVRIQAGALLCILPLIIVFIIMQRYITESVEKTGIVG